MAYTQAQQARIDAAQKRVDTAKSTYQSWVSSYNDWTTSIQGCYKDQIPDAGAASTWFNALSTGPCTTKGSCKQSDVANCKAVIEKTLNAKTIPNLKAAYNELNAAQTNYNTVLAQVIEESKADPNNILANTVAAASASATKYKWIFAIVIVIIVAAAAFIWYKFFRKR